MRLYTAAQMRAADAATEAAGIPLVLLMEVAGRAVAEAALAEYPQLRRVLVVCGRGNNGGDGYVAARHLLLAGRQVRLLELSSSPTSADAQQARRGYLAAGGKPAPLGAEALAAELARCELVIDALFGSGLSRPLEGTLAELVDAINRAGKPVVSIDVPSGVASDSPELLGPHLQASLTLQLSGAKLASAFFPARRAFGRTRVVSLGTPEAILEQLSSARLLDDAQVAAWLPQRPDDAHKYRVGTVLVIAGSRRYLGAAELCCRAAYRAGAGLVTLAATERLAGSWPEIIFEPLDWQRAPLSALAAIDGRRAQVRVIGPGLDERARPYLAELIAQSPAPTVLDAGALVPEIREASVQHGHCVITPHAGEAARLLSAEVPQVVANPLAAAKQLAERYAAVAILKGASTVIAVPEGEVWVSARGHPGMASGGTGDALAGVVAALIAQTGELLPACAAAVYLHGLAGERAAARHHYGLTAGDLIEELGAAWRQLKVGDDARDEHFGRIADFKR